MKVEIAVIDLAPMARLAKNKKYLARMIVLCGGYDTPNHSHKLNKRVTRKDREKAQQIAQKWKDEAIKEGWQVQFGTGCTFD